ILIFDANKDGKNDIYIASGGYENKANTFAYKDQLYINKGKGIFEEDSNAIPTNFTSKSCVRSLDFDNDGDVDLFIGGRVVPKNYPLQASSIILRNDSKNGIIKFTEVTNEIAKSLIDIGLICDAIITDINNDGWSDLIVVGEWMSPTLFVNHSGKFEKTSLVKNDNELQGWWNSISSGDFNNDGKIDYIIGNLGLNSYYRSSPKYPIELVAKDFDNNGSIDPILAMYLPDKNNKKTLYPFALRDDIVEQMPIFRKQFNTYNDYANINFNSLLNNEQLQGAKHFKATNFNSVILLNKGDGNFDIKNLAYQAQWSSLNGLVIQDFDGDGNLDIVCNTNDYSTEVFNGRYDALNGLFLKGNGNGEFTPLSILESGIYIPGNGKALVSISNKDNNSCMLIASQNRSPLKVFKLNKSVQWKTVDKFKEPIYIQLKNGAKRKHSLNAGSSFLSQSSSKILLHDFEKIIVNP
ncbi:MAG: VCBS repeat-containing protein, partial [Sediminibacterium sp.]|nr:VCBS repeat-containing protein [Sediminibacterium sp.]